MSDTKLSRKRCACGESKWIKCADPWYMTRFYWGKKANGKPQPWEDSISRWAEVFLNEQIDTRTRAEAVAKIMRGRIVDGTYQKAKGAKNAAVPAPAPPPDTALTLAALIDAFDEHELKRKTKCSAATQSNHRYRLSQLRDYDKFGARAASACTTDALIDFRQDTMSEHGESSWRKYFGIFNRLFHYGRREGVIAKHPLDQHGMAGWQWDELHAGDDAHRTQRLNNDTNQEGRLLQAALVVGHSARAVKGKAHGGASVAAVRFACHRMHDLIEAALTTAGRRGELLAIRWSDVATGPELTPKSHVTFAAREAGAAKTGIGKSRAVRQDSRFQAMLIRRRLNPFTGQPYRLSDYVFGNELGDKLSAQATVQAWLRTVVLAEGHTPQYGEWGLLDAASLNVYRDADLHFHDLRRECASRWLASGVFPNLKQISELLGHKSVQTTEIYLNVTAADVDDAMAAYDAACQDAAKLAAAVGSSIDKLSTTEGSAKPTATRPRLVKGRKSGADR